MGDSGGHTYQYVPYRGISEESFKYFNSQTKVKDTGEPISIGFRYPNGSYKVRRLDKKEFYSVGDISSAGLFGRDKFDAGSHKYVTITEGELDAVSLWQVLRSPVVSVQSASSAVRDCSRDLEWLRSFEYVYLAFDGDAVGRDATQRVARLFDYNRVRWVKFSTRKDANEYLQHGETDELRNIWWNAKKYLPESIISSFSDFKSILSNPLKEGVPYPFRRLTEMTYGIRTGETVLIKAREKVGKTELMHQIEYQLLKETDDNVGVIFIEEPPQRHLLALAGIELKQPIHLPDHAVAPDAALSAVERVLRKDDRLYVYSHFGSDNPDVFLDIIRFLVVACGCRYVLLDHLSMVVSGLGGEDERRALDYLSTRLEMLVKELDFGLIMVMHVNDEGQTRGSRNPTKVADVVIHADRDLMAADDTMRRTVYLSVPYNRYCSESGAAGSLLYDPLTCTFEENEDGRADKDYPRPGEDHYGFAPRTSMVI